MCLAFLARQLQKEGLAPPFDLRAFIVDHKARVDSTEEAQRVSAWLDGFGKNSSRPSR